MGNEKRVYELVTRHFLACVSMHAEGLETIVDIDVAKEKVMSSQLIIKNVSNHKLKIEMEQCKIQL